MIGHHHMKFIKKSGQCVKLEGIELSDSLLSLRKAQQNNFQRRTGNLYCEASSSATLGGRIFGPDESPESPPYDWPEDLSDVPVSEMSDSSDSFFTEWLAEEGIVESWVDRPTDAHNFPEQVVPLSDFLVPSSDSDLPFMPPLSFPSPDLSTLLPSECLDSHPDVPLPFVGFLKFLANSPENILRAAYLFSRFPNATVKEYFSLFLGGDLRDPDASIHLSSPSACGLSRPPSPFSAHFGGPSYASSSFSLSPSASIDGPQSPAPSFSASSLAQSPSPFIAGLQSPASSSSSSTLGPQSSLSASSLGYGPVSPQDFGSSESSSGVEGSSSGFEGSFYGMFDDFNQFDDEDQFI
jgi:hypothetical protein